MTAIDLNYENKIQEAVATVDQPQPESVINEVVLSSGVVLRHKKFSRLILQAILDKFPYPDPPKVRIPEKDRYEINPNDPHYKEQVAKIDEQRSMAIIDAVIVFGTEVSNMPDKITPIESDDWIEELEIIGVNVLKENKKSRYLAWIKYVAMVDTESDLAKVMTVFSRMVGASEETVAQAIDNFRSVQERTTLTGNQT